MPRGDLARLAYIDRSVRLVLPFEPNAGPN